MANRRFIDFPIATTVGANDIILIWQDGLNKQTTKATILSGLPEDLEDLADVNISGLTNGQILRYDSTAGKWVNTDQGNLDLNDLNDVSIVSPSNGQVLVYNSSTSKWENSSAGFVPYTGAVTTVNLGAQTIQAGSFVKAGGTSAQFLKADGSVDSNTYGTGTVTSVGLTMPAAFSVANSPVTAAGTLAVTGAGTTSQYIQGDGTLATFPALTGFVPYTGATADVNLGTHDLAAERGTFENNGSSNTLTVNHTSGSGYGIIVTKGGNNEALYVSKTSGSGNAMTVVGGRTSLVDLALSSVTNTAGDFLTLSGGVVHKRTAAQTLTDIGGQAALTNPVTGTGTTNFLPKFTGSTTIGDSVIADNATEINIPKRIFLNSGGQSIFFTPNLSSSSNRIEGSSGVPLEIFTSGSELRFSAGGVSPQITLLSSGNVGIGTNSPGATLHVNANNSLNEGVAAAIIRQSGASGNNGIVVDVTNTPGIYIADFRQNNSSLVRIASTGNLLVGTTTDGGARLQVSGDSFFNSSSGFNRIRSTNTATTGFSGSAFEMYVYNGSSVTYSGGMFQTNSTFSYAQIAANQTNIYGFQSGGLRLTTGNASIIFATGNSDLDFSTARLTITSGGNVGIGTTAPIAPLQVTGQSASPNNGFFLSTNSFTVSSSGSLLRMGHVASSGNTTAIIQNLTVGGTAVGNISFPEGNVLIGSTSDPGYRLFVSGNTYFRSGGNTSGSFGFVVQDSSASNLFLVRNDGLLFMSGLISSFTTGNAANMFVSPGDGAVYRSTSSIKYKKNVKNYEKGLKEVLNLRPVTYEGLGKIDSNKTFAGLIAEEVHELGLNEFVQYAEDGTPDALGYQNMIALLTKAIQELKQEIDTLKN